MKIPSSNQPVEFPPSGGTQGSAKPADGSTAPTSTTPSSNSQPSVSVTLSSVSQSYNKNVSASSTDVFNAQKVDAMRTAIQNGSFSPNPQAIADKLLSNAREMLRVASAN